MQWIRRSKVHGTSILVAVLLAAASSAFADVSLSKHARWVEHNIAISSSANFQLIDRFVRSTVSQANLDAESIKAIVLYLDNREYEMAFEGLFLELISSGKTLKLNTNECMTIALQLKLDKASVFDHQFWSKFEKYLQDIQNKPIP
ncbi:hypothetical protein V9K92_10585 [Phyllobacterium sp. CCNWLW109]|uniref:hypothetical protein n=1 Tax=Phyllobacterium sp. CCNWLW109 TaxID=3127479 RepID=UPI0030785AFD